MPDAYIPMEETGLPEARLELGEFSNHPKVLAAYELARLLHRDQAYGNEPGDPSYIVHVVGVANKIYEESVTHGQAMDKEKLADELCAALLHDSVEDQPDVVSKQMIRKAFGDRVGDIVAFCTDRWEPKYRSREPAMEDYPLPDGKLASLTLDTLREFCGERKTWVEGEKQKEEEARKAKEQRRLEEAMKNEPLLAAQEGREPRSEERIRADLKDEHKKKDGIVGPDWMGRKQDYLSKLQKAASHPEWRGRLPELESAVTICCADKLMNMWRTNQRLEYAIAHGSEADPLIHQFWASFNSAQMARPQYDFLLANAFKIARDGLDDVAEGRFSSLVSQFSGEVEVMRGMMTNLKGTKEQFPRFQQQILQERGNFSEPWVTTR